MSIHKYLRWTALVVILSLANVSDAAAALVALDSSFFNHKYEGDVVPVTDSNGVTTPSYTVGTPDISGPTTDGNVMTYQNSVGSGSGYWESNANIWAGGTNPVSDTNGWTIEFKIKVGAIGAAGPWGAFQVFARDNGAGANGNAAVLLVGPDGTSYRLENSPALLDTNSNTNAFHTFRIAQEAESGNMWVWRDNIELLAGANTSVTGGGTPYMFFGDGGGDVGGPAIELEYFRWDSTGAYAPIPEPNGFVLASLGVLGAVGCWVRRRPKGA